MQSLSGQKDTDRPTRASAFVETGLLEDRLDAPTVSTCRPRLTVRFRSKASIIQEQESKKAEDDDWDDAESEEDDDTDDFVHSRLALPRTTSGDARSHPTMLHRLSLIAVVISCAIALTQYTTVFGEPQGPMLGATGFPLADAAAVDTSLGKRQSPTDVCKRWSQQSALVNGTLYLYGGRAITSQDQTSNTWNNDFLSIDLTKTWQISSPSMSAISNPSGPPAVANGYLWNSYDSLFLYGGEFSDNPQATPSSNSLWEYDIKSSSWKEHSNPQTSTGQNSENAGEPVQRAAEGAGFSLASLGKGWYFGGHLDFLTTQDWSNQVPRLYLKSFIEYTFPGYAASDGTIAGPDGAWRNITNAGIQTQSGFTQRADGILVYVPGFGPQGILLSLGGGTNESFVGLAYRLSMDCFLTLSRHK